MLAPLIKSLVGEHLLSHLCATKFIEDTTCPHFQRIEININHYKS